MIGIDLEYIPENAAQGVTPSERPDVQTVYCEIIQMGACKLDSDGNEIDILNLTVRTHRIPHIPAWLTRITGMTDEIRDVGISFPEALQKLVDFIEDDLDIWTFSGDWWVLKGNAAAHTINFPFQLPFQRLKPLLPNFGINQKSFTKVGFKEVCSGGLYKALGIRLPEIVGVGAHDAAHDARSLVHSVYFLEKKRIP